MENTDIVISIRSDTASDRWGFVGVICVGDYVAYRTLEAAPNPREAEAHAQALVGEALGELLAAAEWRQVKHATSAAPTRRDYGLGRAQPRPSSVARPAG
jgi:hypothetical protein